MTWRQQSLPGANARTPQGGRGREFENALDSVHRFYLKSGIVDVVKNPVRYEFGGNEKTYVAKTRDGRYLIRKKSDVDYSGGNDRGSYIFDAKQTNLERFPFDSIEDHQVVRLRDSARCGTRAGVMIYFKNSDRVFFVPIAAFQPRYERWLAQSAVHAKSGTASLSVEDCAEIGVEVFRHKINGLWDWFSAIGNG